MFERILIPVDFTEANFHAIERVASLANERTEIILLHVIEEIEHLDDTEDRAFYAKLTEAAGAKMQKLAKAFEKAGLNPKVDILVGRRAAQIVAYAKEREADLIVLSSHPLDWEEPWKGIGSTSHRVAIASHCPVFLIK